MTIEEFFTPSEMKDGLTTPARVEELFTVMQRDKDGILKNVGDTTRHWSTVASTIAATENKDCLDLFIQLDGLCFIDKWLKDAQTQSNDTGESFSEESIAELLRALEKLRIDNQKSVSSGIWVTIKNLIDHNSSRVQDMARALIDSWKQDSDSNEVPEDIKKKVNAFCDDGLNVKENHIGDSTLPECSSPDISPSRENFNDRENIEPAGDEIQTSEKSLDHETMKDLLKSVNKIKESATHYQYSDDIKQMQKISGSEKLGPMGISSSGDAASSFKHGIGSDSKEDIGIVSEGKSRMDDGVSPIQDGRCKSDILGGLSGNKRKLGEIEGPRSGAENEDDSLKRSDVEVENEAINGPPKEGSENIGAKVADGIHETESSSFAEVAQEPGSNTEMGFCDFDLNQEIGFDAINPPAHLNFDLNVSEAGDNKIADSIGEKQIPIPSGLRSWESSLEVSLRKEETLQLDLNLVSDGSEYQTLSRSSSSSSSMQPASRIFDLNDQPFFLNDSSSHQYFGKSFQNLNASDLKADENVISLMGTRIEVNPKNLVPHTPSWKDVSLSREGPNVHLPIFGYNGLTLGPTGPIQYIAAPVAPQLMTAFSQPPFIMGPLSVPNGPGAHNFDLNSALMMDEHLRPNRLGGKGKELDSGWELYPLYEHHQQP